MLLLVLGLFQIPGDDATSQVGREAPAQAGAAP